MQNKIFETASFHIVKPCNMKCKFCYATFDDMHVKMLSLDDAKIIMKKLADAGLEKITFAGGEPLLYPYIKEIIKYSKGIGLTTSIITNGAMLTDEWLKDMRTFIDWIGLSIDSINMLTLHRIGRKNPPDYPILITLIKKYGYKLKINTVVNAYNWQEDMNDFINWAEPARWKVFQALRVEGQNDKQFDEIKVSEKKYRNFIFRHISNTCMVAEDNEAMTGSYLLIDPQGRLFENSTGKHTYSSQLQHNEIDTCLSEINLNRDMFVKRGGIYEW